MRESPFITLNSSPLYQDQGRHSYLNFVKYMLNIATAVCIKILRVTRDILVLFFKVCANDRECGMCKGGQETYLFYRLSYVSKVMTEVGIVIGDTLVLL